MNAIARALAVASRITNRNPSEAQKSAGNYEKGKFRWHGLEIAIENPKGSKRYGTDTNGKKWKCTIPAAYGYIKQTRAIDGDHVDVYVGSDHDSKKVWVIDQVDAKTGKYDEPKCLLSFKNKQDAVDTYTKAFSDGKGKDRIGAVTELTVDQFKAWATDPKASKYPLGDFRQKRASGGMVADTLNTIYGNDMRPELVGADAVPVTTEVLADRMHRYDQIPEWMKAIEPYDASLSHWLQASPWGGYPEALERRDLAAGPLGGIPWMAYGAGKALQAPKFFDAAKGVGREELWDAILSKGMMPARAEGGPVSDKDSALTLANRYYSGDLAPEVAVLPSDLEAKLESYPPLRDFQPFQAGPELRGTGMGESRDPNSNRPHDYMQPVVEAISPTMGGYGMGYGAGSVYKNAEAGDYKQAGLEALPLLAGMIVPGAPKGVKGMRIPREIDARGFYSPSLEAAKALPQEVGTAQQMTSMLLKHGAKPKELEAVGYHKAFADPNAKITRQEIEDYLRSNRVQLGGESYGQHGRVEEMRAQLRDMKRTSPGHPLIDLLRRDLAAIDAGDTSVLRNHMGGSREPRYESYSTPGGIPGSYREVVTTLPPNRSGIEAAVRSQFKDGTDQAVIDGVVDDIMSGRRPGGEFENQNYTSSHWPGITNPLLHYRTKDFPGSDNLSKTRVLDEMQSDWAQRARDAGVRDPVAADAMRSAYEDARTNYNKLTDEALDYIQNTTGRHAGALDVDLAAMAKEGIPGAQDLHIRYMQGVDRYNDLANKFEAATKGVPSAPYISNTSDWVDLGLKQALIDAARDSSVSRMAWAPGSVQAQRYGLEKHINKLSYDPESSILTAFPSNGRVGFTHENVPPDKLSEYVGRDVATRLLQQPIVDTPIGMRHVLEGQDLAMGGEGMRSFYGDMASDGYQPGIVGTRLSKLVKGLDPEASRVEPYVIDRRNASIFEDSPRLEDVVYPSVKITPEMRRKILEGGLPLFLTPLGLGLTEEASDDPVQDILKYHYGDEE